MIVVDATLAPGAYRLTVVGHENRAAGEEGRICAAVSALTQTVLLGLEHIAEIHPDLVQVTITESENE